MSEDFVNIEIDGVPTTARKGQMIIEVTDEQRVYVPRFCYHEKLTVAANCRMCLVEVENAPKPLPACATPVADGMKVFTRSEYARGAQKAVMEFLLINHPLDCPICDQGGECELQDLAMGYGKDSSRFTERKRVVKDKNIGPLISTDMTRCIQCTRCTRFTEEIAGFQELGTIGRGETMQISTYIGKTVDHELSGNVIDLCPVGALNNKPFRFRARSWEMLQVPLVSPHDCTGANLFGHVLRGKLLRVVPRMNEEINETWISDRDRYACYGIYASDRVEQPLIKSKGEWRETGWEDALARAAAGLKKILTEKGPGQIGMLASPNSTLEEFHLLSRLADGLGTKNIDHRLRQTDFSDQDADPVYPWLGTDIAGLEKLDAALIVGSNLRNEVPLLAHRIRKVAVAGAGISFLNPREYRYLFPVAAYLVADDMAGELAALVAAAEGGKSANAEHRKIIASLNDGTAGMILLGHLAQRHPAWAGIRAMAAKLAGLTGASLGYIPDGGNAVAGCLAGVLPHRDAGGKSTADAGLDAAAMLASNLSVYLLLGCEPEFDCANGEAALKSLAAADLVVAIGSFASDAMKEYADVILPTGSYAETPGTYVNAEGRWQSVTAAAAPVGQSRPAWKVLRVLGNLLDLDGFDYQDSQQVRDELAETLGEIGPDNAYHGDHEHADAAGGAGEAHDVPMYRTDAIVRRSRPLQETVQESPASPAVVSF